MERAEAQPDQVELLAVPQPDVALSEERMISAHDLRARRLREGARADDEVLVAVRLEDELDHEIPLSGRREDLVDVPPRVHHDRLALVAEQVGDVSETWSLHPV
ncbi:hypothetical protein WMF44_30285 [Sorangium sp. So ce426]